MSEVARTILTGILVRNNPPTAPWGIRQIDDTGTVDTAKIQRIIESGSTLSRLHEQLYIEHDKSPGTRPGYTDLMGIIDNLYEISTNLGSLAPPGPSGPPANATILPTPPSDPAPTPAATNDTPTPPSDPAPTPAATNDTPTPPSDPAPTPAATNDTPTPPSDPAPTPAATNDTPTPPSDPAPTPAATNESPISTT